MIQTENFKSVNGIYSPMPLTIDFPTGHILIMPQNIKWPEVPRGMPAGYQQSIIEGNTRTAEQFTFRAKIPSNWKAMPHFHPTDEYITVIEGSCYLGIGEQFNLEKATKLPTGAFSIMRPGTVHYFFTLEECIIQVHGTGPQKITYINPDHDPRNKK